MSRNQAEPGEYQSGEPCLERRDPYYAPTPWTDTWRQLQRYGQLRIQYEATDGSNTFLFKYEEHHRVIFRQDVFPAFVTRAFPPDMQPKHLQVFDIQPLSCGGTHKDGMARKGAFNIPLQHCEGGRMQWWDSEFEMFVGHASGYSVRAAVADSKREERHDVVPSFQTVVNAPAVVNTDVWHRMDNRDNPHVRYMLSIRFRGNPSYESIRDALCQ